jgi:hypothetical protein
MGTAGMDALGAGAVKVDATGVVEAQPESRSMALSAASADTLKVGPHDALAELSVRGPTFKVFANTLFA